MGFRGEGRLARLAMGPVLERGVQGEPWRVYGDVSTRI